VSPLDAKFLATVASEPRGSVVFEEAQECHMCGYTFTFFVRRHHCRDCGHSVCNEHSLKRHPLSHRGGGALPIWRICDGCDLRLTARAAAAKLRHMLEGWGISPAGVVAICAEAPPQDASAPLSGAPAEVYTVTQVPYTPSTFAARCSLAQQCITSFHITSLHSQYAHYKLFHRDSKG
jgi:hypothetical protein